MTAKPLPDGLTIYGNEKGKKKNKEYKIRMSMRLGPNAEILPTLEVPSVSDLEAEDK